MFPIKSAIICLGLHSLCSAESLPATGPFAGEAGGAARSAAAGEVPLHVMTFNVRFATADDKENRWELRREALFHVLRQNAPDVVGLQETLHEQLEEILKAVPGYARVGVGRDDGDRKGELAAIIYLKDRFALEEQGTFWLSETPEVIASKTWDHQTTRVCTWARLSEKGTGRSFYVYNVHLDHESQRARERAVELVVSRMEKRRTVAPAILVGDFNAGQNNPAIKYLLGEAPRASSDGSPAPRPSRLVDTYREVHPGKPDQRTFHGFRGGADGERIDFIFVEPSARVGAAEILDAQIDGRYPSDHYPVTARIVLPAPRSN